MNAVHDTVRQYAPQKMDKSRNPRFSVGQAAPTGANVVRFPTGNPPSIDNAVGQGPLPRPTIHAGNQSSSLGLKLSGVLGNSGYASEADKVATETARAEEQRYQEMYRPLNQELIQSLNTEYKGPGIDFAKQAKLNEARRQRQMSRYGMRQSAEDQVETKRLTALNNAAEKQFAIDNAYRSEFDRRENVRAEMMNLGRGIATSSQAGLDTAAANATNRANANEANKAAADQAKSQAQTSMLASAAMIAAMIIQ